ncbi:hypothetical protein niasHT_035115 [Heterodera trifolii]|uniref:Uncharacterized protein n=1 Tax=Heterodera trifolii TaxID=157864 RepID=A0ABD2IKR4_9BILA
MMVRHTPDNEDDPLDMLNDAFGLPLTSSVVEDPDRHADDQLPVRADTLEPMNNGPNDEKVPRNPGGQSQRNRRPPQRFSPGTLKKTILFYGGVPATTNLPVLLVAGRHTAKSRFIVHVGTENRQNADDGTIVAKFTFI